MRERAQDFHVVGKPLAWSARERAGEIAKARGRDFELVILGGGITGAGLAREAALRGIPFLLVEQEDFAFGTSSRSSKLVHGGLRYLPQGELRLVRESSTERNWLRQALPNLVRPLGFHYCAFEGAEDTPAMVRAGLLAYEVLSEAFARYKSPGRTGFLKPAEMAQREPAFRREGLRLAGLYYDTATDDARLVIETLKEARDFSGGGSVALNYCRAERVLRDAEGRVSGVALLDRETGEAFEVPARCVVNATGVWGGGLLGRPDMLRPTKGVHVVVPAARLGNGQAFALRSVDDGRFVFVLRRGEVSVLGTTDTDYRGPLDAPVCEAADCDYLLRTVNAYFPGAKLTREDILSTYAGLRPLLDEEGKPSEVSREHEVLDDGKGLVSVVGGKLTTFRPMAWEALTRCAERGFIRPLRGREARRHFSRRPFKVGLDWEAFEAALRELRLEGAAPEPLRRHLHQKYGHGAVAIVREIRRRPELGEPLLEGHPFCAAEVEHLLAFEQVPRLADLMGRRTEMRLVVSHRRQRELALRVADLMAGYYGWDGDRTTAEVAGYLDEVRRAVAFCGEGA